MVSKHAYAEATYFIQNDSQYNILNFDTSYAERSVYEPIHTHTHTHTHIQEAGWSGDRIPMGTRFPAPVQTGPEAHPAFHTMGTGSFPGVKRPGRGVYHPPHLEPRLKKE